MLQLKAITLSSILILFPGLAVGGTLTDQILGRLSDGGTEELLLFVRSPPSLEDACLDENGHLDEAALQTESARLTDGYLAAFPDGALSVLDKKSLVLRVRTNYGGLGFALEGDKTRAVCTTGGECQVFDTP